MIQTYDFERHIPALTKFAVSLTRNQDAAGDLVQETIMKLLSRADALEDIQNMEAYMMQVMKRLHVDTIRRGYRLDTSVDVDDMHLVSADAPQSLKSTAREVMELIGAMPAGVSGPLLAYARDDKSYAEISAEEGVPIGTVTSRINRARQALVHELCQGDADCIKNKDLGINSFAEIGL